MLPLTVRHVEAALTVRGVLVPGASHAAPDMTLAISQATNGDGTYAGPVTLTLSATATDPSGDTSEFSACVTVTNTCRLYRVVPHHLYTVDITAINAAREYGPIRRHLAIGA